MSLMVKKRRNISPYSIGEFESYLSDMAKEGLMFCGFTMTKELFKKREPAQMEYRLELSRKSLTGECMDLYQQHGWKYITSYKGFHVFSAPVTGDLKEVHTDYEKQSQGLKPTISFLKKIFLLELSMLLVFMAWFAYYFQMIKMTPTLSSICDGSILIFIAEFIIIFWGNAVMAKQFINIVKTREKLKKGIGINHHAKWKKGIYNKIWVGIFLIISTVPFYAFMLYSARNTVMLISGKYKETLTITTKIPTVRLNDIEKCDNPKLKKADSRFPGQLWNYVRREDMLLCKKRDIEETFYLENETWEGEVYQPSLNTEYYEILVPFLTDGVLKDVIYNETEYFGYDKESTTKEIKYKGLNKAYYIKIDDGEEIVVVQKGNKVVRMKYYGKQAYTKLLDAAARIL